MAVVTRVQHCHDCQLDTEIYIRDKLKISLEICTITFILLILAVEIRPTLVKLIANVTTVVNSFQNKKRHLQNLA